MLLCAFLLLLTKVHTFTFTKAKNLNTKHKSKWFYKTCGDLVDIHDVDVKEKLLDECVITDTAPGNC